MNDTHVNIAAKNACGRMIASNGDPNDELAGLDSDVIETKKD
jgi:hypothetical protein